MLHASDVEKPLPDVPRMNWVEVADVIDRMPLDGLLHLEDADAAYYRPGLVLGFIEKPDAHPFLDVEDLFHDLPSYTHGRDARFEGRWGALTPVQAAVLLDLLDALADGNRVSERTRDAAHELLEPLVVPKASRLPNEAPGQARGDSA